MLNESLSLVAVSEAAAPLGLGSTTAYPGPQPGIGEELLAGSTSPLMLNEPELALPLEVANPVPGGPAEDGFPIDPQPLATEDDLLGTSTVVLPHPAAAGLAAPVAPSSPLEAAWQQVIDTVDAFRQSPTWQTDMTLAFSDRWQIPQGEDWLAAIASGDVAPEITVVPTAQLQARGAYAASQDTIYLADSLLHRPTAEVVDVMLEELGHFLDDQLNPTDTPGDEGAIFAALAQQRTLTADQLSALQAEDDTAEFNWQGQTYAVEQAAFETGSFTVGADGQIAVEFIADSGAYQGELAVFSLAGMESLTPGSTAFIQEAARRALSNSEQGYVVISDITEGAARSGKLGEKDRNSGPFAGRKTFSLQAGDQIAVMLVPDGSVEQVFQNPTQTGSQRPLFSIAEANPGGAIQMGQLAGNSSGGAYGLEDISLEGKSDGDYNDVIFRLEGATGQFDQISELVRSRRAWLDSAIAQDLMGSFPSKAQMPLDPPTPPAPGNPSNPAMPADPVDPVMPSDPADPGTPSDPVDPVDPVDPGTPSDPSDPVDPVDPGTPSDPSNPVDPVDPGTPSDPVDPVDPVDPGTPSDPGVDFTADINTNISKFGDGDSEAAIAATGAARITIGTQTIYIGTQQASANNQNPIIALFDSANPANNWIVDSYETTGADGRGQGLAWDGENLYAVFTVDGTQGNPTEDFRRASNDAQQAWLRTYGQGGGAKVSVLGRIDPSSGELLDAAYLSAILSNGNSNTLTINSIAINASGNLVVSAESYFSPRRPNGSAMTQVGSGGSPFAYTLEITSDLKQVVSTAAVGWV